MFIGLALPVSISKGSRFEGRRISRRRSFNPSQKFPGILGCSLAGCTDFNFVGGGGDIGRWRLSFMIFDLVFFYLMDEKGDLYAC